MDIFSLASRNDPKLHMSAARWHAYQQQIVIKRAALLTNVQASGVYSSANQFNTMFNSNNADFSSLNIDFKQPVIAVAHWRDYQQAKLMEKSYAAVYQAELQDLIARTIENYLDVLEANSELELYIAETDTYLKTVQWERIRFKAGTAKSVDVDSARAAYVTSLTAIIDAENNFLAKAVSLQALTGVTNLSLAPLKQPVLLQRPLPDNLEAWMVVIHKNPIIMADEYKAQAGKLAIASQRAGHYPTLSAGIAYVYDPNNNTGNGSHNSMAATLSLAVPLYAGGETSALTKQAAYEHQAAIEQTRKDYYEQSQNLSNSYYGVVNGLTRLQADKVTAEIDRQALKSTKISYQAGISAININDLIRAQRALYAQERNYIKDQRDYLVNVIKLKQAAGLLTTADLRQFNALLCPTCPRLVSLRSNQAITNLQNSRHSPSDSQIVGDDQHSFTLGSHLVE